jgi:hypothetical protein
MERRATQRDAAHVDREYNQEKWPEVDRAIREIAGSEANPRLDRVLTGVARTQWFGAPSLTEREHVFGGQVSTVPSVVAFGGQSAMVREMVIAACTDETDLVVELGAGWAWHLLSAWLGGGPANAGYVAAEYTEAGRQAATRLAALDSDLDFKAIPFDYNEPAFDGLDHARHAVVFSQHSIEQIPQVRPELFAAIRGLADRVTCFHFEPVGWQADQEGRSGSSAEYADHHDYNRNLVSLLRRAEADGSLQLDVVRPEVVGVNAGNATSVVAWHA